MSLIAPPTSTALGREVAVIIDPEDIAAATKIPTLAEVNAGDFVQLHIYGDLAVTANQNTGEGPRPLGSRSTPTRLGLVNYPAVTLQYSIKPQGLATPGSAGNEAWEALEPGSQRVLVILLDKDGEETDTVVAGDVVDVYLVDCGIRAKGRTGDGEFDIFAATSQLVVAGGEPLAENHALAAA